MRPDSVRVVGIGEQGLRPAVVAGRQVEKVDRFRIVRFRGVLVPRFQACRGMGVFGDQLLDRGVERRPWRGDRLPSDSGALIDLLRGAVPDTTPA